MKNTAKFTFLQQLKTRSYISTTVIIAVLLFVLSAAAFRIIEAVSGGEDYSDITAVYVADTSSVSGTDYNVLHSSGNEFYADVEFIAAKSTDPAEACAEAAAAGDHTCVLEVKDGENGGFTARLIRPEGFAASKKSAKHLSSFIEKNFRFVKYQSCGLDETQKSELLKPSDSEISVIGEDGSSVDEEMIKNIVPVFLGVMLYMMLCIYGQSVARTVVLEKDSKTMETLLVMTRPYSLIFGKIIGMYLSAVLQIAVWVISLTAGVAAGISVSGHTGEVVTGFISRVTEKGGLSVPAAVTAAAALLAGFFLYVAVAAFTGTFASKTEEVNNYYGIYAMLVVVCWMIPYISGLEGNEHVLGIVRYIPFTSPFIVPTDVLLGTVGLVQGIVCTVIMAASSAAVVFIAAKVYRAFVLYRGEPPKMKDIVKIIRNR